jgi:hypothetical protein
MKRGNWWSTLACNGNCEKHEEAEEQLEKGGVKLEVESRQQNGGCRRQCSTASTFLRSDLGLISAAGPTWYTGM